MKVYRPLKFVTHDFGKMKEATETVREALNSTDCKVTEGMEVAGIMNAQIRFYLPGNVAVENSNIVPISQMKQKEDALD